MNNKLKHVVIAFLVYFSIASIIELTIGWGMKSPWVFLPLWALCLSLANVFLFKNAGRPKSGIKK
ncbi:hypothetical protein ACLI09_02190 [Flavobacterium sp. RHBU_24]|uniref:hypothetical protein n=1 Tax=Flavobacterium sp. RHBU_24 TaxID=3391185 RepID=UPI003984746E